MKNQKAFTLIEVMIVVVIVAILAAIAVPSYQDSIRKTRRADAKEALTRIAALQERYFFTNNGYGTFENLGLSSTSGYNVQIPSQEGFYNIRLVDCGTTCFQLQATPTGAQAQDTDCALFSLNHVGQKTATSEKCW
jgi:prepilin-type N-terminal cleavage/methylation domain